MLAQRIIYEGASKYGSFTIEELVYEGRQARVLFSGPNHAAQSGIALDEDNSLLFDYNKRFYELALQLRPRRILILGGGTMTLAMSLADALPEAIITVVEQNAELIKVAEKFFNYRAKPRLQLRITDAAKFVHSFESTYDLIIVDLFNNFTIPLIFRGVSFARQLCLGLKPDGVIAINCIAGLSGEEAQPLKHLVAAYSLVARLLRVVQANNSYGNWLPQNLIVLTSSKRTLKDLLPGLKEVAIPELNASDYLA